MERRPVAEAVRIEHESPPRQCPRCRVPLETCRENGVELDRCPDCDGLWFDAGEIQRVLGTRRSLESYVPPHLRTWRQGRLPCPVCATAMHTLPANRTFPFELDQCPAHRGYWIDGAEVRRVAAAVRQHTYRLRQREPPPAEQAWQQRQLDSIVTRAQSNLNRRSYHPHPAVATDATPHVLSLGELGPGQLLLALIGVPVEEDTVYRWRSFVNLLVIVHLLIPAQHFLLRQSGGTTR